METKKFYGYDINGNLKAVETEHDVWLLIERANESREFTLYLDAVKHVVQMDNTDIEGELEFIDDDAEVDDELHERLRRRYVETYIEVNSPKDKYTSDDEVEILERIHPEKDKVRVFPKDKQAAEHEVGGFSKDKQIVEYDIDDNEDEDYTCDLDSCDELMDDIIYNENVDKDIEWVGMKENKTDAESDSSYMSDDVDEESDFNSVASDVEEVQSSGSGRVERVSSSSIARPNFELGQIFSTKLQFKEAVNNYSVQSGRPTKFVKNDTRRIYARCKKKDEDCDWHINALKVKDEQSFQIRELDMTHTCARQFYVDNARSGWLAKRFERAFRCDPKKSVKGFRSSAISELGVYISPQQAVRARTKALKLIEGDCTNQYSKLWDYAGTLLEKNPGSTVILELDDTPTGKNFKRLYVCLSAVKKGFMAGCRPWIGVDGCHLSGQGSGVLLTSVCMDPNNDPYPLAFVVVSSETRDSWEWFLKLLKDDLLTEREDLYIFMSDKQKGLIGAFESVLPTVENRFCVRHLHGNMKKAGFKGQNFKTLLWKAANASTIPAFQKAMAEIELVDKKCLEWLKDKPPTEWSKSHFSTFGKCDTLVNNMCEQFNHCLLDARDKPILTMLEWIREYMMSRLQRYRDRAERRWEGKLICGRISKIVGKNIHESKDCIPVKSKENHYEVMTIEGTKYVVNLEAHTCGCRRWELTGIPCKHAISAICAEGYEPENYVSACYSVETYNAVYSHAISPMNGEELWEKTGYIPPLPPAFHKKKSGRPQKQRKFGANESPKKKNTMLQRMRKQNFNVTCQYCGQKGHNKNGCAQRKIKEVKVECETSNANCEFCLEKDHTKAECEMIKAIERDFLQDEVQHMTQHDVLDITQPEAEVEDITQPEKENIAQHEVGAVTAGMEDVEPEMEHDKGDDAMEPCSTKPTTRHGRKMLAMKKAAIASKVEPRVDHVSQVHASQPFAPQRQVGVQIRAPPPMAFHPNQFIRGARKADEGSSLNVFTAGGKKFINLSTLRAAAEQKRRREKE